MLDTESVLFKAMNQCTPEQKVEIIKEIFGEIAQFIDTHDIIVPELSVTFGALVVKLSAQRLPASTSSTSPAPNPMTWSITTTK